MNTQRFIIFINRGDIMTEINKLIKLLKISIIKINKLESKNEKMDIDLFIAKASIEDAIERLEMKNNPRN